MHKKILKSVGADNVVLPENESGTRLAKNLVSTGEKIEHKKIGDNINIAPTVLR